MFVSACRYGPSSDYPDGTLINDYPQYEVDERFLMKINSVKQGKCLGKQDTTRMQYELALFLGGENVDVDNEEVGVI